MNIVSFVWNICYEKDTHEERSYAGKFGSLVSH